MNKQLKESVELEFLFTWNLRFDPRVPKDCVRLKSSDTPSWDSISFYVSRETLEDVEVRLVSVKDGRVNFAFKGPKGVNYTFSVSGHVEFVEYMATLVINLWPAEDHITLKCIRE